MGKVIWIVVHIAVILVHIGLVAASIYGFISCGTDSATGRWRHGRTGYGSSCTSANARGRIILPWVSTGVGAVTTLFNVIYAAIFLLLSKSIKRSDSRRTKSRVLLVVGIVINAIFLVADVAFGIVAGLMAKNFEPFIAVCVLAVLAAIVLILTTVVDGLKVRELARMKQEGTKELGFEPAPVGYPQTVNAYQPGV